jgi:hypothetical protein
MNKRLWIVAVIFALLAVGAGLVFIPNPLGKKILAEAKYRGYIDYTPEDAVTLAYSRCTACHDADKMLKYCSRCGPPFIVVAHTMKKYVELMNKKGGNFRPFSDAEIVAITQAWNALVGNWEPDWGLKDVRSLLKGDEALIKLAETPLEKRRIEVALKNKSAPGAYRYIYGGGDGKQEGK